MRSSAEEREHWHSLWAQTSFKSAGLQRYFTVQHDDNENNTASGRIGSAIQRGNTAEESGSRQALPNIADLTDVLEDWDIAVSKHQETLEVADAEIAKTDHTLWFRRTVRAEHLSGSHLKHLSQASRLPDRRERMLQKVAELNSSLIE